MLNLVAYIDAGSGSMLLAAVASGAAGVWFFVRSKIAAITGRNKPADSAEPATPDTDQ